MIPPPEYLLHIRFLYGRFARDDIQNNLLTGLQYSVCSRPFICYSHFPAHQRSIVHRFIGISIYIEDCTEYLYILLGSFYTERTCRVACHFKISLTFQKHLAFVGCKRYRIAQFRTGIQEYFCSICKHYLIFTFIRYYDLIV